MRKNCPYSEVFRSEWEKIRTIKTPNANTFYAVFICQFLGTISIFLIFKMYWQGTIFMFCVKRYSNQWLLYSILVCLYILGNFYEKIRESLLWTLQKKWSFPLKISPVNVTKSAVSCGLGHIDWRNPNPNIGAYIS